MPLKMVVSNIQALTAEEIKQIKDYIQRETILDVVFVDASGEVMKCVGYTNPSEGAPVVTVIKNGSVVKASVEPTLVKLGLIMPSDSIGDNGDSKSVFIGALYSDGEVKLCVDKTAKTKCLIGTTTKSTGKYGDPSFVISPSPATTSTTIAIDTIPNVKEVKALGTLETEQELDNTKGLLLNGLESPVAVKVDDTTPVSADLDEVDVIMEYEA